MAADIMICCMPQEERTQRIHSHKIDRLLAKQKLAYKRTVKILLLGSGESGKSTFLKQMKIIHGVEFEEDQVQEYKTTIYGNIVKGMKVLVDARSKLDIPWENTANDVQGQLIYSYDNNVRLEETAFQKFVTALESLWQDGAIKRAFERRREFQLGDSVKFFLNNLEKIKQRNYIPSTSDILLARKPTKGINEIDMDVKGIPFKFVDVGGQRSQRQKWFQCFENVTSILFLSSSSEFDQVLMEDRQTNRLIESCNIFETIVNNKCFVSVSIILFLNKTDLLRDKVRKVSIKKYFPEFQGDPHRLEDVQNFLLQMFDMKRRDQAREKPLFHHFTTAIDTDNIKFVFQAVKDIILQDNLKSLMLQ